MGKIGTKRTTNDGGSSSDYAELCSPTSSTWLCCGTTTSSVDTHLAPRTLTTLASYDNFQNRPIGWYRKKRIAAATITSSSPSLSKSRDVVGGGEGGDWYDDATHDVRGWFMEDLGSLFGSTPPSSSSKETMTATQDMPEMAEMKYVAVLATMTIKDTIDNGPVIEIRTLDNDNNNSAIASSYTALQEYILTGKPWWESIKNKMPSTIVPLYVIDTVTAALNQWGNNEGGKILLHAAPNTNTTSSASTTSSTNKDDGIIQILNNMMIGISGTQTNRQELLRFDPLPQLQLPSPQSKTTTPNYNNNDVDDDAVDTIVEELMSLVITNRQNMARDIINGKTIVAPKSTTPGYILLQHPTKNEYACK